MVSLDRLSNANFVETALEGMANCHQKRCTGTDWIRQENRSPVSILRPGLPDTPERADRSCRLNNQCCFWLKSRRKLLDLVDRRAESKHCRPRKGLVRMDARDLSPPPAAAPPRTFPSDSRGRGPGEGRSIPPADQMGDPERQHDPTGKVQGQPRREQFGIQSPRSFTWRLDAKGAEQVAVIG